MAGSLPARGSNGTTLANFFRASRKDFRDAVIDPAWRD